MRRGGFVLPLALVVMVAVSVIAVTTLQVAMNDFRANRGMRLASRALYVAEAGADRTLARWASGPFAALAPGDSAATGWTALPDGGLYRATVLRVDDASGDTPLYHIRVEGRPSRRSTARRRITVMVEAPVGGDCCGAAAAVRGELTVRAPDPPRGGRGRGGGAPGWTPPPQVDGRDHIPAAWSGYCPSLSSALAGLKVDDQGNVSLQRGATLEGTPALEEDPTVDGSVADALGSTSYAQLAAAADLTFPGPIRLGGSIRPSARRGVCDTSDIQNWGAPTNPGSACWDYLPVIHVRGDLRIDARGAGQGILLVDGDLTMGRSFDFYGAILVKGQAVIREGATVTGVLQVANRSDGQGRSQIRDDSLVRFSACATARATGGSEGAPRYLQGRHWFEIP